MLVYVRKCTSAKIMHTAHGARSSSCDLIESTVCTCNVQYVCVRIAESSGLPWIPLYAGTLVHSVSPIVFHSILIYYAHSEILLLS